MNCTVWADLMRCYTPVIEPGWLVLRATPMAAVSVWTTDGACLSSYPGVIGTFSYWRMVFSSIN